MKPELAIVPFSHLDLFWAGTRRECLTRGIEILRTALELLERYPEYRFMIESISFLEFFLDACPQEKERVSRLTAEGRLEVIPMRAILYTQLPSGETLVRNFLSGKRFCREHLPRCSTVATLSDIPGVTPQIPQIAAKCGMTALLLSHGTPPHTDHIRYRAPDGTEITGFAPVHYGRCRSLLKAGLDYEEMLAHEAEFEEYFGAVEHPQICQWGVDLCVIREQTVRNILRWNAEGHRQLRFSTLAEFFERHAPEHPRIIEGEIPSLWPNVESSWPDLWPLDGPCEYAMFTAEYFGVLHPVLFDRELHRRAWDFLLDAMDHNQNGIGGAGADRDKRQLKESARFLAEQQSGRIASILATRSLPHGSAKPIAVFNPLSWRRSETVRGRTVLYGPDAAADPAFTGSNLRLVNEAGAELPFRILHLRQGISHSVEVEFEARDIPAFGVKYYYLEIAPRTTFSSPFLVDDGTARDREEPRNYAGVCRCENRFWRLEIDRVTGELSLYDKTAKRQLFERTSICAREEKRGDYICRMDLTGRTIPAVLSSLRILECDAVVCRMELRGSVYGQEFRQLISLFAETPVLELENTIFWEGGIYARIEQNFPFQSAEAGVIRYGAPFGSVRYPETIYRDGLAFETIVTPERGSDPDPAIRRIRLAQQWVHIGDSISGVTIGADHRMWEFDGNLLRSCMLRGIGYTSGGVELLADGSKRGTARPPRGEYLCRYRLESTPGGAAPTGRCGRELNAPLYVIGAGVAGTAKTERIPLLPDTTGTTLIGSVKPAENGDGIVFRVFETAGIESRLHLPENPGMEWQECDLVEENRTACSRNEVRIRPFEIKTFILTGRK